MSNDGINIRLQGAQPILQDPVVSSVVTTLSDVSLTLDADQCVSIAVARPSSPLASIVNDWVGRPFAELLAGESVQQFEQRVGELTERALQGEETPSRWAELEHRNAVGEAVPVRYAMHWIPARKEVLMLGQDQRMVIEMQQQLLNAQIALEQDYETRRELDTRYRLLMDFTSDAVALVAAGTGRVVDANHNAASLLGVQRGALIGTSFPDRFVTRDKLGLIAELTRHIALETPEPIDVEVKGSQSRLLLTSKLFRAAGEQLIFVRMVDPEFGAVSDGRLIANLRQLFYRAPDAIVFADRDGRIVDANETFLNLTDMPSIKELRGISMSEFLARSTVDLKVLIENAQRSGQVRFYSTKLKTGFDAQIAVEISATWLDERIEPMLALVIRNASTTTAQRSEASPTDSDMRGVMELVGSSTLKEIVADTTNVIEKICIETAIELTRNNRVAAAEMLGLSRQSLYVKLRKYGILSRDEE
ncbi:MAG: transcriptional regulator PpsR [Rhodobacteraceae bacterium]|nr:transcriptional regulator PpsR [Paracoccaceae bacterium]